MRRLRHTVEQILAKLCEAEIALSKREQPKLPVYKTLSDHVREVVGKEHLKRTKPLSVNQINGGQALAELITLTHRGRHRPQCRPRMAGMEH